MLSHSQLRSAYNRLIRLIPPQLLTIALIGGSSVWIGLSFLAYTFGPVGTVKFYSKISDTQGNFTGVLADLDTFGLAVTSLNDLDGDGITDLAVGSGDEGTTYGAVWILFMNTNGIVRAYQKISQTEGNFTGILNDGDGFGNSLANLNDLDGDGISDLAVGAYRDNDGGNSRGTIWILFMNANGTVKSYQKISNIHGNFTGMLDDSDAFGISVTNLNDLDKDGVADLAVGASGDSDGGDYRGAVWILFMNVDGTVKTQQKISDTTGSFNGILDNYDNFGLSVTGLNDLDGDSVPDLAVGAPRDDDGGSDRGAVWILFMNIDGSVRNHQKISDTAGNFSGILDDGDSFGSSVASQNDLDGDGVLELAVGAIRDDDGGSDRGAVWILFMNADGSVKNHQKISDTAGNFSGILDDGDGFGSSIDRFNNLDGDGTMGLAVGAILDDDGGNARGAVWLLYHLNDSNDSPYRLYLPLIRNSQ